MGLETGTYLDDLVVTNPTTTDKRRQGDDHLRLLKTVLKNSFPNVDGAVNPSVAEFNYLVGVTSLIQTQLDAKLVTADADGAGLTESGGVLAVGAGDGIAVNADDVAIDISGLTAIEGNAIAVLNDGYLVDDNGTPKRMAHSDAGIPVLEVAGTVDTIQTGDMNRFINYTTNSGMACTFNTGVGKVGNFVIMKQSGTGQVVVSGTATFQSVNGEKTRVQHSVIVFFCTAANTWAVFGDTAA